MRLPSKSTSCIRENQNQKTTGLYGHVTLWVDAPQCIVVVNI